MDAKSALRWAVLYRGVTWLFGLVGLAFVYLGFRLSVGGLPLSRSMFFGALANPRFLAPALLGFVLWQFGKTVVFYKTVTEAVEEQMTERFDAQMVKSEILEVLDERLAEMETEIRQTRSEVRETSGGGATAGNSFEFEN